MASQRPPGFNFNTVCRATPWILWFWAHAQTPSRTRTSQNTLGPMDACSHIYLSVPKAYTVSFICFCTVISMRCWWYDLLDLAYWSKTLGLWSFSDVGCLLKSMTALPRRIQNFQQQSPSTFENWGAGATGIFCVRCSTSSRSTFRFNRIKINSTCIYMDLSSCSLCFGIHTVIKTQT